MMNFKIGDRVVYSSAASINQPATVINIDIAKNAADNYIPWITLEFYLDGIRRTARLAAIPQNLKMMKIRKLETV